MTPDYLAGLSDAELEKLSLETLLGSAMRQNELGTAQLRANLWGMGVNFGTGAAVGAALGLFFPAPWPTLAGFALAGACSAVYIPSTRRNLRAMRNNPGKAHFEAIQREILRRARAGAEVH